MENQAGMRNTIVLLLVTGAACLAQSPAFEVASIRLNVEQNTPSVAPELRNGRLTAGRTTLKRLLAVAYGVTEPQVTGPDWLDKNRFDIVAKAPESDAGIEMTSMLQSLIKERFKLASHLETKTMPVYHLMIGQSGVKMPVYPQPISGWNDAEARGFPMMRGTGSVAQLAYQLTMAVGRPVVDKTALKERYNYALSFAPLSANASDPPPEFGPPRHFYGGAETAGAHTFPVKDDMLAMVVDHIEMMPTEN